MLKNLMKELVREEITNTKQYSPLQDDVDTALPPTTTIGEDTLLEKDPTEEATDQVPRGPGETSHRRLGGYRGIKGNKARYLEVMKMYREQVRFDETTKQWVAKVNKAMV